MCGQALTEPGPWPSDTGDGGFHTDIRSPLHLPIRPHMLPENTDKEEKKGKFGSRRVLSEREEVDVISRLEGSGGGS